MTYLFLANVY